MYDILTSPYGWNGTCVFILLFGNFCSKLKKGKI